MGRFGLRSWRRLLAIEVFDRSMSVAAQFFTSLIPLSIAVGTLFGRDWRMGASLDLPDDAADIVDDAISGSGTSTGVVGILLVLVLVLATSLSRTLTRLYCAVFGIAKPPASLRRLSERIRQQADEYLDRHGWDVAGDESAWREYQQRRMAEAYSDDEW